MEITNYIVPVVMVCCACVGYCWKNCTRTDNRYIPAVMAILGAIINVWMTKSVDVDIITGGMVSGLASTGAYEMITKLISGASNGCREDIELTEEEVLERTEMEEK